VNEDATDLFRASRERSDIAAAVYRALRSKGELGSHRILSYRCPSRCLLVDVLNLPQGVIFHVPAYKLSPQVNDAASSPEGRAKNTSDGQRRWKAHTFFQEDCVNVSLNCDHVRQVVLEKVDIQKALDARHAEVVVLPTGERRAR